MDFKEYQEFAAWDIKPGYDLKVFGLGLGGETGEVLEILKKAFRDEKPIDMDHLAEELGDVVWYIANICTSCGLQLQDVIDQNVSKLKERYKWRKV